MDTQAGKPIKPLMWAVAVAIIVFCAAGTAAMMGWIPVSLSRNADLVPASTEKVPFTQMGVAPAPAAPSTRPVTSTSSESSAPESRSRQSYEQPMEERREPVTTAAIAPRAPGSCRECGVVQGTREIAVRGESSGLGAVGGAVVGGVLGNQVGSGSGKQIATVVGAVGGVIAGNEIEKRVKSTRSYEVTVRLDDGSSRVITQSSAPAWRSGDRVRIVDGGLRGN